jgi:hypothetical protein
MRPTYMGDAFATERTTNLADACIDLPGRSGS